MRSPKDANYFVVNDISRFLSDSIFDDVCMIWIRSVHLTLNGIFHTTRTGWLRFTLLMTAKKTFEGKIISNYYVWHTYTHTHRVNKISGRMKSIWRENDKLCQLNCHTKIKKIAISFVALVTHTLKYTSLEQAIFIWMSFYTSISTYI